MIMLKKFFDKFNKVESFEDSQSYWQFHEHRDLFSFWHSSCGIEYDGKFMFRRTSEAIKSVEKKLLPYVISGEIPGFKYKSDKTPIISEYADKLPPIFIYCKKKQAPRVSQILELEGIKDAVWLNDNRTIFDSHIERIVEGSYFSDKTNN